MGLFSHEVPRRSAVDIPSGGLHGCGRVQVTIMRIPGFKSSSVSSDVLMELVLASLGSYLVFHPGLVEPRSCAVAISMGLALLFLKPTREGAFSFLGPWVPLLILWAFLSSFWSFVSGLSLQASSYLCLACSVFLTVRSLSEASRQRLLNFGFALASLAALLGVLQWLWGFGHIEPAAGDYPTADYEMLRAL